MGLLTTFTVRHDHLDDIEKNPVEFAKLIVNICAQGFPRDQMEAYRFLGKFNNLLLPQRYYHSGDFAIFAQTGNSTTNMSSGSDDTTRLAKEYPALLKRYIKEIKQQMKFLTDYLKETEKKTVPKKKRRQKR